jgi:hypothetical protein
MTAVEWLIKELFTKHSLNQQIIDTFEHAKEMEKQPIIDAKDCWFEDERDGEQYYNETYKKNGLNNLKRSKIMKNIYLLPTDKPSRLIKNNHSQLLLTIQTLPLDREIGCFPQNIYITSDEEIKEGEKDFYIIANDRDKTWINCVEKVVECKIDSNHGKVLILSIGGFLFVDEGCKIILTTDQDLIADGVQAIDDEFLQWYVNNPSCEFVKTYWNPLNSEYDFMIPKEEPKPIHEQIIDIVGGEDRFKEIANLKPKQEAFEEAASNLAIKSVKEYMRTFPSCDNTFDYRKGFEEGYIECAKWLSEKMYSEEELRQAFRDGQSNMRYSDNYGLDSSLTEQQWFDQFKKK